METNKETFKKSLDKLIPEHDIKINELFERA
jgi:dynein heavy chain